MEDKITSIRLNEAEQKELDDLKQIFGLKNCFGEDSKTIKLAVTFSRNVIRNLFGDKLRYIFDIGNRQMYDQNEQTTTKKQ